MGALALRPADLREFNGQARVQDLRLAEVLGFANPVDIRKLIRRKREQLEVHGELFATVARKSGARGRPINSFYLNERQAYRLCMWSDAPNADAVQEQMVEVFFAWRHGKLVSTHDADPRWAAMELRLAHIERLLESQRIVESREYAVAVTYAPEIFALHRPDGSLRKQRRPKFWSDIEVREALIQMHRQMPLHLAVKALIDAFGESRAPSKSAIHRFWKQHDLTRMAA